MSLANAPGKWRWEKRTNGWWRIHEELNIENGPYTARMKRVLTIVDEHTEAERRSRDD